MGASVSAAQSSARATLFEPTPFVGRENELAQLARRVGDERLVTIAGSAGYGKTRLALRFGVAYASSFVAGGVWFIDLRSAFDVESACVRVSRALGIADEGSFTGQLATRAVGRALAALGRCLVILDNAEHLQPKLGDAVLAWLDVAPELRLLVTSRSPLGVFGEDVLDLEPLEGEHAGDAVQLYIERVRSQRGAYQPDERERARIADLLAHVGGIPLAVELCAAAAEPNAELGALFPRDPIAWSFARLSPVLREVLVQCSVFRGRFSHEAANAVIVLSSRLARETPSVLLARLVELSLIQEAPGSGRMWLCEGARCHAQACLDDRPDANAVRLRHALHFAHVANEAVHGVALPPDARAELEADRDDLEAALDLAAEQQRSDLVLAFCSALDLLARGNGLTSRQLAMLDSALLRAPADPARVGRALGMRASALRGLGRLSEAARDARVALTLARESGDRKQITAMLVAVGMAAFQLGELDVALQYYQSALEHARSIDDHELEGTSLQQLGGIKQSMADAGAAQLYYSEALDLALDRDDEPGEMRASAGLGSFYLELGAYDRAEDFYHRALLLAERLGIQRTARIVLGYLGVLHFEKSLFSQADDLLSSAIHRSRAVGDVRVEAIFEGIRAGVLASLDRLDESTCAFDLADRLLEPVPFFRTVVQIHRGHLDLAHARAERARGDTAAANQHVRDARLRIAQARKGEAPLFARSDDARIAVRILERAIARHEPAARS